MQMIINVFQGKDPAITIGPLTLEDYKRWMNQFPGTPHQTMVLQNPEDVVSEEGYVPSKEQTTSQPFVAIGSGMAFGPFRSIDDYIAWTKHIDPEAIYLTQCPYLRDF